MKNYTAYCRRDPAADVDMFLCRATTSAMAATTHEPIFFLELSRMIKLASRLLGLSVMVYAGCVSDLGTWSCVLRCGTDCQKYGHRWFCKP